MYLGIALCTFVEFAFTYNEKLVLYQESISQPVSDSKKSGGKAASLGSSNTRNCKSAWMPFPMLFDAISNEVSPQAMEEINMHYGLFRVRFFFCGFS